MGVPRMYDEALIMSVKLCQKACWLVSKNRVLCGVIDEWDMEEDHICEGWDGKASIPSLGRPWLPFRSALFFFHQ